MDKYKTILEDVDGWQKRWCLNGDTHTLQRCQEGVDVIMLWRRITNKELT